MAMREYEFNRFRIQKDILRVEHMKCKACGAKPLACHVDGNMKCYRCESAQGLITNNVQYSFSKR